MHGVMALGCFIVALVLMIAYIPTNWADFSVGLVIGLLFAFSVDHAHRWVRTQEKVD
jgi:ABC-type uncharacterized transport system permease subunit